MHESTHTARTHALTHACNNGSARIFSRLPHCCYVWELTLGMSEKLFWGVENGKGEREKTREREREREREKTRKRERESGLSAKSPSSRLDGRFFCVLLLLWGAAATVFFDVLDACCCNATEPITFNLTLTRQQQKQKPKRPNSTCEWGPPKTQKLQPACLEKEGKLMICFVCHGGKRRGMDFVTFKKKSPSINVK